MVAIMKYENGLKFNGVVCENTETAHQWLKEQGIVNPNSYKIIPVSYITKDLEAK